MTDHHDFDDHHYFEEHHDPVPLDDDHQLPFEQPAFEHHFEDDTPPYEAHLPQPDDHTLDQPDDVAADPLPEVDTAAATVTDDPVEVFPPPLDVGDLPEPVDGFPWIDTGSLGVVDVSAVHEDLDPVRPEELAEYAGTDLPPGVDPWAALADSDDPATSALARWWSTEN